MFSTSVCQEFCPQGGGGGVHPPGQTPRPPGQISPGPTPPLGRHPPPKADIPQEDGYCSQTVRIVLECILVSQASVCSQAEGVSLTETPLDRPHGQRPQTPLDRPHGQRPPLATAKSGRHASYWNAFLFVGNFPKIDSRIDEISQIKSRMNHPILRGREGEQGCWLPLLVTMFLHFRNTNFLSPESRPSHRINLISS